MRWRPQLDGMMWTKCPLVMCWFEEADFDFELEVSLRFGTGDSV